LRHVVWEVAVLADAVQRPAADEAEFLVGAREVEPGADVTGTGGVDERDRVGCTGQPSQDAAGLLPVRVEVVPVPPRRIAAQRRVRGPAVEGFGLDLLDAGRRAGTGRAADWGQPVAGEDPPPCGGGVAVRSLLVQ